MFVSSTSPFNIIALDRLKNLMNIAFVGNTEQFQVPAITSYLLSYRWTSNIVPVTISLRQFPEDVSINLPIVLSVSRNAAKRTFSSSTFLDVTTNHFYVNEVGSRTMLSLETRDTFAMRSTLLAQRFWKAETHRELCPHSSSPWGWAATLCLKIDKISSTYGGGYSVGEYRVLTIHSECLVRVFLLGR